jgi:hypothetical protein
VQKIAEPEDFLEQLGGLHDCTILDAVADDHGLTLAINDLNWNSEGLPEYAGARPARLVFRSADKFRVEPDALRNVWVSALSVVRRGDDFTATLVASTGQVTAWTFQALELHEA